MAIPSPLSPPPAAATDAGAVVRAYYRVVADLASSEADLVPLLDPELRVIEHPNALVPAGTDRDREQTLAGFRAGKALLAEQAFVLHEMLATADTVAVRATWSGVVARDIGGFTAGARLTAHVASFLTVRDGRIVGHETFDCYEPFERDGTAVLLPHRIG
jgi:ketosteroid isomerase-like protein